MVRAASALDFLTAAQKAAGQVEVQKLRALDTAPEYLVAQVLAWAKRTPGDPRVPEALHLAVRSTRSCARMRRPRSSPNKPFNYCTSSIHRAPGPSRPSTGIEG